MLRGLHVALQRRVLRKGLKVLRGDLSRISGRHISDILRLVKMRVSNRYIELPGDITVKYIYDKLYLSSNNRMRFQDKPYLKPYLNHGESIYLLKKGLTIPGSTFISILCVRFDTEIRDINDVDLDFNNNFKVLLDYEKSGNSLWVRTRRPGDRFHPLGMSGSKKLKDFFIDEKVQREERDLILLLVSNNKILWVVGMRVSEEVRLTDKTKKVLIIDVKRS
jgi:tRNA(Ile)-lysidine synthase